MDKNAAGYIDFCHLKDFEEQWVALDAKNEVVGHAATLAHLRKELGAAAMKYAYFFVPSSRVGYSGSCPR